MSSTSEIRALESPADLDALLEVSTRQPVMVFKHSTRCPISAFAHREFLEYAPGANERGVACAIVLVVERRALSLAIADRLGVVHQSPQAILVRDGTAVWNESHEHVSSLALEQAEGRAG